MMHGTTNIKYREFIYKNLSRNFKEITDNILNVCGAPSINCGVIFRFPPTIFFTS